MEHELDWSWWRLALAIPLWGVIAMLTLLLFAVGALLMLVSPGDEPVLCEDTELVRRTRG